MQIYYNLEDIPELHRESVLTFGVFDGLHLGHRAVIEQVIKKAKDHQHSSTVLTFYPHPMAFLAPESCPPTLTSCQKRLEILQALGVDIAIFVRFDQYLAQMSPKTFVQDVLIGRLRAKHVIVGYACQFGINRTGDSEVLKSLGVQFNFDVTTIPPKHIDGSPVHSTRVREAVVQGSLDLVAQLLARRYSIIGEVVRGDGRGRQLGFPTANIDPSEQIRPPNGVYAIRAKLENQLYDGVLNMGMRPTVNGVKLQIESHLFDFDNLVYGKEIEIFFIKEIRAERKFAGIEALVNQIQRDVEMARNILEREASHELHVVPSN